MPGSFGRCWIDFIVGLDVGNTWVSFIDCGRVLRLTSLEAQNFVKGISEYRYCRVAPTLACKSLLSRCPTFTLASHDELVANQKGSRNDGIRADRIWLLPGIRRCQSRAAERNKEGHQHNAPYTRYERKKRVCCSRYAMSPHSHSIVAPSRIKSYLDANSFKVIVLIGLLNK